MTHTWEADFVAASLAIGQSIDDVVACLGEAGAARAAEAIERLGHGTQAARAAALANVLATAAADLEGLEVE
jgi:hypothetical protein